jgi:hypothetical protein
MRTPPLSTEPAGPTAVSPLQGVYLIHLDEPYFHARHYVGYADDIARRVQTHRRGLGSPLLAAALATGIDFRVVRIWPGADRRFERKLHNRHGSRLCPESACVSVQRERRLQLRLRWPAAEASPFGGYGALAGPLVFGERPVGVWAVERHVAGRAQPRILVLGVLPAARRHQA